MKKIPHRYIILHDSVYVNLVTRRFIIRFNGISYYNEISSLKDEEVLIFTLLRELVAAKHQLIGDLYRIKGNVEGN